MSRYAEATDVAPEKSRLEIERTLQRYGADGFFYGSEVGKAIIGFRSAGRTVKMVLPLPVPADFAEYLRKGHYYKTARSPAEQQKCCDQAVRTKWRCLALAIKAKLEVVESGISTFESEFLAHILTSDGTTVGEKIAPQLDAMYQTGRRMPLLLEAPK